VHYLAREFKKKGHDVRVVGPAKWIKNRHIRFEYPVHRWPTLRGLFTEQVQEAILNLDVALWGCDVIHAHSTYPCGFTAVKLKRRRRIPLVITPHGVDIHMIPKIGFGLRLDPSKRVKIENAIRNAEFLTAISASVQNSLVDAGCPQTKISKIPNGIDLERFKQKNLPDARKWLGIEPEAPLILSVGHYHPRKGHEVLIQALPRILQQMPSAHLVIVGRNPEPLKPLIRKMNLTDHVHLTGSIPFPISNFSSQSNGNKKLLDRLASLYCSSTVYVSSGIDEGAEGLSLALLDAMAAGLPVVATLISGNKDLVKNNKTGFLLPHSNPAQLADAVLSVIKNPSMAKTMGIKGHELAQSYSWKKVSCRYLEIYQRAIDNCG
jgi:glycosyltransferase involved in cell wall biosynthesis